MSHKFSCPDFLAVIKRTEVEEKKEYLASVQLIKGKQTGRFFVFPAAELNQERERKRAVEITWISLSSLPASATARRTLTGGAG